MRSIREDFAEAIAWHLEPFRRANPEQHALAADLYVLEEEEEKDPLVYSYVRSGRVVYRHTDIVDVLREAVWDLQAAIPKLARDFLFLHAGTVARDGRALLLPARMEHGKSTLTAALVSLGWNYLSDELAAIDPISGRPFPFPKKMGLDAEALERLPTLQHPSRPRPALSEGLTERFVAPDELGGEVSGPEPARWIVFPSADFSGPARLEPLTSAEAVEQMAVNALNLYRYGQRGIVLLSRVAQSAEAFRLTGGTPMERAEILTRDLGR